jgi:hypothetical protein
MMKITTVIAVVIVMALGACAGRTPQPVRTVQATDHHMSCLGISSEIDSNNAQLIALGGEQGQKVAQNVAAGVAGLFIWPLWFAMDFQDAAGKEATALQARNAYLAKVYAKRDCAVAPDGGRVVAERTP